MSGQAEQELGKRLGGKDEREFGKNIGQEVEGEVTGKIGRWEDTGRYVYLVREDREANDVGEEKDVGKKADTCIEEVFGHKIAGVVFRQEVGECFECNEGWEYDQTVGSMKAGQAQYIGSQVDLVAEQEVDEEGGATLEDERGRRVGGMKKVGRYNGDDVDSGVEDNDEEKNDVEDIENAEDVDVDAGG